MTVAATDSPISPAPCGPPKDAFRPRVESYGRVHCAIDHDMANVAMVEVAGGYVVIDTSSSPATSREIRREFESRVKGSPQAVIYTHSHPDHIGGAAAFCDPGVSVWAQDHFADELEVTQLLPAAYFTRGAKQYGAALPVEQRAEETIGPPFRLTADPRPPVRWPTHTFAARQDVEIGGVRFELHAAAGETHDHLFVWLPDERVLLAGDNIYRAFPNLYAIRGVPPRPVRSWIDSLDAMRRLDPQPEVLVLGHTETVEGATTIHELLTIYRDAIARVHDGVVAGINAGKTPDELVAQIELPADLRQHPYLQERYGTLRGSIRGIYCGYMGWFDGDGSNLDPLPLAEVGQRLVPLLGGVDGLIREIRRAQLAGNHRWALWLAQALVAAQPNSKPARQQKAELLELLAENCPNPLMKNWMKSDALVLRGGWQLPAKPPINGDTIAGIPIERIVRLMPARLDPVRAAKFTATIAYDFTDSGQQFTFYVRRGVGEVAPGLDPQADVVIRAAEDDFKRILVANELKPLSAEYWKRIQFIPRSGGVLGKLGMFRLLLQLKRCMIQP